MSDYISREDALTALNGACSNWQDDSKVADIINGLPSAKVTGDLISRADAIEAVTAIFTTDGFIYKSLSDINTHGYIVEALNALPSAEAEQVTSKLDSAEAVTHGRLIDADALSEKLCETTIFIKDGEVFQRMINDAPTVSAEAEQGDGKMIPIELKKRYPHSRDEDITDAFMRGYKSAQSVQGWIPCSERLPECGFGLHYLVTLKDGHVFSDDVYEAFFDKYGWHVGDNELAYDDIIAWMPLPTPYKGGEDE